MPRPRNMSDIPSGARPPLDLEEAALQVEEKLQKSSVEIFKPISTGFENFDECLGGGLHSGDLALIGGVQNIGKTAVGLQFAGNIVDDGSTLAIFVCYEHSTQALFERLLVQHSFVSASEPFATADQINAAYLKVIKERDAHRKQVGEAATGNYKFWNRVLGQLPNGLRSWGLLSNKRSRIWLNTGHSLYTSPDVLEAYVNMAVSLGYQRIVLFVDYVQRVPMYVSGRAQLDTLERIDYVLKALKGMALDFTNRGVVLAVIGIAAADATGLRQGRIHVENLYGDVTVQYEPDVAFIMNKDIEKIDGCGVVRIGIEKNRHGPSDVEWRHKHYGAAFLFDRTGLLVPESESWQHERKMLQAEHQELMRLKLWEAAMRTNAGLAGPLQDPSQEKSLLRPG